MDNKELEFELLTNKEDKRNKLITLTPKGKAYASEIIEALHKRELCVMIYRQRDLRLKL